MSSARHLGRSRRSRCPPLRRRCRVSDLVAGVKVVTPVQAEEASRPRPPNSRSSPAPPRRRCCRHPPGARLLPRLLLEGTRSRSGRGNVQSGRPDLNRGPHRPERCALPGCATPRCARDSSRGAQGRRNAGARPPRESPQPTMKGATAVRTCGMDRVSSNAFGAGTSSRIIRISAAWRPSTCTIVPAAASASLDPRLGPEPL